MVQTVRDSPGIVHHLPAPSIGPAGEGRPGFGHIWSLGGGQLIELPKDKVRLSHANTHCREETQTRSRQDRTTYLIL